MNLPWYKRTPFWAAGRLVVAELRVRRGLAKLPPPDAESGREALLLINHFFDGEIAAMNDHERFVQRYQLIVLPPRTFFRANWSYFPPAIWRGDDRYDDPTLGPARARSAKFARRLLRKLMKRYDVRAVATPSDSFFWVREFLREAKAAGLGTFVFDKEGVVSPATFENQPKLIAARYPPIAELFYVWNQRQTDYWQKAGVPSARIRVLGSLRTDLFVKMPPPEHKAVLFFDFDTCAYLEDLADPVGTTGGWRALKDELHAVLLSAIERFPEVSFTIKCHPQQTDIAYTRERFGRARGSVKVVTGSVDVHHIVEAHSIVLGFQTTALLETALTSRPALYCGWGPLHERVKSRLLPLMEPGFGQFICNGPQDVFELLTAHLGGSSLAARRDRSRLGEYFENADGNVAGRYLAALGEDLR